MALYTTLHLHNVPEASQADYALVRRAASRGVDAAARVRFGGPL